MDAQHVNTALNRIEKGCREANVPYIERSVWGIDGKGKITLERFWCGLGEHGGLSRQPPARLVSGNIHRVCEVTCVMRHLQRLQR